MAALATVGVLFEKKRADARSAVAGVTRAKAARDGDTS